MNDFALQITNGCKKEDIEEEYLISFEQLLEMEAIKLENDGLFRLTSLYRAGELYINKDSVGFVESLLKSEQDLMIDTLDLKGAKKGDVVVAKRIMAKRGRSSGKVVLIAHKAHLYQILYTKKDEFGNFLLLDLRTGEPSEAWMSGLDLRTLASGSVLKVDIDSNEVVEIMGNFSDPKIDEKLSLLLFEREDDIFPKSAFEQAIKTPLEVLDEQIENRVDLRHLDFCTIDPVTAKDFDDAIYFDTKNFTLYVAIADVSYYVDYFSPIDQEAKKRGFTTYLPHKAFPMLPRELSENICSLKPKVDRLAFVAKIELDSVTLEAKKEEFFEAVIHSKHRFNYEQVDGIISGNDVNGVAKDLWDSYLSTLYDITKKLRAKRLKSGFDFRTEEIKIEIDKHHLLKKTSLETGTPSHSLIEECMLLANQAAARKGTESQEWIYRIHEAPNLAKIEELLSELATIGLYVEHYEDSVSLIRAIQKEAAMLGIGNEVDAMIIKSLKQASYAPNNLGHFGLGFEFYSHFTSPIRRYSDLILHRLIKTGLKNDTQEREYLLRNITPLCARVSELERKTTKCEWDFRDRKFARWADEHKQESFDAHIIEAGENAKALLDSDIKGIVVSLRGEDLMLFERVVVAIYEVDIPSKTILAKVIKKIASELQNV